MNNRILFMIIGNEVKYLQNSTMDHREWYISLGQDPNLFDSVVRGFIEGGRIIFYKGSTFSYDEEVIKAAKMFTPNIRFSCSNPSLEAYCGITFQVGDKWEPIMKLNENEITGFVQETKKEEKKEEKPMAVNQTGPIIELKNDFDNDKFRRVAVIVTGITLVITFLLKIMLFQQKSVLNSSHFTDILLVIGQIGMLGVTIYGYLTKKSFAKYSGIVASFLIVMTLDFLDIVVGVLYFLFCIDQNYFVKAYQFVKKLIDQQKNKKNS